MSGRQEKTGMGGDENLGINELWPKLEHFIQTSHDCQV